MPPKNYLKNKPYSKKGRGKKPLNKKIQDVLDKNSETKLIKDVNALSASSPLLEAEVNFSTPYFNTAHSTFNDYFNPITTDGGHTATDYAIKDFVSSGVDFNQRVGRAVHIKNINEHMVFRIGPSTSSTSTKPTLTFRIVQGWIRNGVDQIDQLRASITHIYDEMDWTKFKIKKDYIMTRKATYAASGVDTSVTPDQAWSDINLKFNWKPDKTVRFDKATQTGVLTPPAQYTGWTPFVLIMNQQHDLYSLKLLYHKRSISYKDM